MIISYVVYVVYYHYHIIGSGNLKFQHHFRNLKDVVSFLSVIQNNPLVTLDKIDSIDYEFYYK